MERISSLKIAIENEAREEKYYLEQAKRTNNPVVKTLLENLASEEVAHQDWIEQRHAELVKNGIWPEQIEVEKEDLNLKAELSKLDYKAKETSEHDAEDIACLKKAIQLEMEAADFYYKLAEHAQGEKEKAFFTYLGKIEHDHMVSIKESLEYLEDPVAYYTSRGAHIG